MCLSMRIENFASLEQFARALASEAFLEPRGLPAWINRNVQAWLFEFCDFNLRFFQKRDIGVGVLPQA